MNAFEQLDPNNIAFDMLQDKDTEHDIIRIGESLLDRLHAHTHQPSPEVQKAIKTMHGYLNQLKVEFDEHFKNRITMLCHVPKVVSEGQKVTP
jgi:quinol monooxygenase YgiN